jgi:hypothetical protein
MGSTDPPARAGAPLGCIGDERTSTSLVRSRSVSVCDLLSMSQLKTTRSGGS